MAGAIDRDQPGLARANYSPTTAVRSRVHDKLRSPLPILLIVAILFGVSGGMLWLLGYNYDGITGGVLTKIHPSSYLIVGLIAWNAVTSGNPVGYAVRGAWMRPGSFLLVVASLLMFAFIVARKLPGMAGAIDTFIPAPLLVLLVADMDPRGFRQLELLVHGLMTVNAIMALVEFVTHVHFFPYRFDGAVFPFDVRSTALQGHPLVNAAITAWYSLALLTGGHGLSKPVRYALIPLQLAALVTFGGRAATVVTFALATIFLVRSGLRILRTGRIPLLGMGLGLFLLALIPVAVAVLAEQGFFNVLLERFVSDGGSAHARVEMFALFDTLSFRDLLVGPDPGLIETLRRVNGLEWGIEQPVVKTVLYDGILITIMMFVALTAFLWEVARLCRPGVWLPMLCFVTLLQTSESIATKTTIITKFVIMMLCLYRMAPVRVRLRAAAVRVPRSSPGPTPASYRP